MSNGEAVKRLISMYGRNAGPQACPNCIDEEAHIKNELTPHSSIPVEYKHFDVDSVEGKAVVDEKKLEDIPYAKDCVIYKTEPKEHTECREITGFDKNQWTSDYKKDFKDYNKTPPKVEQPKVAEQAKPTDIKPEANQ